MGLIKLLSILFWIFTIVLFFYKSNTGKSATIFGVLTFLFVTIYSNIGRLPLEYTKIAMFIFFSLMLLTFGIMNGLIALMLSKSHKISIITSIITSMLLMMLILKMTGILNFVFIPILLYKVQGDINKLTNY